MLRSNWCDFSDTYIVVKGDITLTEPDNAKRNKSVAFRNNAPFMNCILNIDVVQIDNAEDFDAAMKMYNLLKYSKNSEKQQVGCGIITQINQVILILLVLNVLNTRRVLQEILTMLMVVKPVMMKTRLVKMKLKLLYH